MLSKTILIILSYTVFSWCIFGTQCTYLLTVTYHFRRKMFLCRVLGRCFCAVCYSMHCTYLSESATSYFTRTDTIP